MATISKPLSERTKLIVLIISIIVGIGLIEYSQLYLYEKSYSYYALVIPFFCFYIFISIQKLMYQRLSGQQLSIPWLISLSLHSGVVIFGLARISHYYPVQNYIFGTGGMLIILACIIAMFRIKKHLKKAFLSIKDDPLKKMTRRFSVLGAIVTAIYLIPLSLILFKA